jgi:hypothetical protein
MLSILLFVYCANAVIFPLSNQDLPTESCTGYIINDDNFLIEKVTYIKDHDLNRFIIKIGNSSQYTNEYGTFIVHNDICLKFPNIDHVKVDSVDQWLGSDFNIKFDICVNQINLSNFALPKSCFKFFYYLE